MQARNDDLVALSAQAPAPVREITTRGDVGKSSALPRFIKDQADNAMGFLREHRNEHAWQRPGPTGAHSLASVARLTSAEMSAAEIMLGQQRQKLDSLAYQLTYEEGMAAGVNLCAAQLADHEAQLEQSRRAGWDAASLELGRIHAFQTQAGVTPEVLGRARTRIADLERALESSIQGYNQLAELCSVKRAAQQLSQDDCEAAQVVFPHLAQMWCSQTAEWRLESHQMMGNLCARQGLEVPSLLTHPDAIPRPTGHGQAGLPQVWPSRAEQGLDTPWEAPPGEDQDESTMEGATAPDP